MKQQHPSLGWAFFKSIPFGSSFRFQAAVFFTFSSFGFLMDISDLGSHPASVLAAEVVGWGLVGTGYFFAVIRDRRALPLVLLVHILLTILPDRFAEREVPFSAVVQDLEVRLTIDAIGCVVALTLGFVFFITFIRGEGSRYLRAHTEIDLAKAIHRDLVLSIDRRSERFEFYGASAASGEVGGDLLDLVGDDLNWIAYVADVSGHGVPAGVVMGMFKSAARMRLKSPVGVADLLNDLNGVLFDLKSSSMFITCACVRYSNSGRLEFGLAGHLPILHLKFSTGTIDELSVGHFPVGMFEESLYPCGQAHVESGDLLVLLTDGLTEVSSPDGEEFGLERIKQVVIEHSSRPLQHIFEAVMAQVRGHGPQHDDQTLLLIRCKA